MSVPAFAPCGPTITIGASTTTANAALAVNAGAASYLVVNPSGNGKTLFVVFGKGAGLAATTANGTPVPAGGSQVIVADGNADHVAVILDTAGTSGNVYLQPGN